LWTRQKLQNANHTATAAQWFSNFLENAFVSLVNRRTLIQVLRLDRSTMLVRMRSGLGRLDSGLGVDYQRVLNEARPKRL
jgi:hypothetical protein